MPQPPDVDALHLVAVAAGRDTYTDPKTGYDVFTALSHERRGSCCGCGCRHCPFGLEAVSTGRAAARDPYLIGPSPTQAVDVLFWSGGKDSYLALRAMQAEALRPVVLFTTFDARSRIVAHQQVPIEAIVEQAEQLDLALVLVPLGGGSDYGERVRLGLGLLRRRVPIVRIASGDLHLHSIRAWRETHLGPLADQVGAELAFPLWNVPYAQLEADLSASGATCRITAFDADKLELELGEIFNERMRAELPAGVDAFGEQGEFHTLVQLASPHPS
ncbi:MAG: DUF5522 domain-containing protein [Myxococcota bacterium]